MKCDECNFEAKDKSELSWHLSENHGWPKDQTPVDMDMSEGPRYCQTCDYEAEDGYQLDAHTWSEHDDDNVEDDSLVNDAHIIGCNICEEKFGTIRDLMRHKKKQHCDRVAVCWKFESGNCIYGDTDCWFRHCQPEKDTESTTLKCNVCDKEFKCQTDLHRHRKKRHSQQVSKCKHEKDGKCIFGSTYCWFIHENHENVFESENNDESIKEHSDVIQKVFGMLEIMTKRIMKIENYNTETMETT